jgi:CheY-like chemotaxis protein
MVSKLLLGKEVVDSKFVCGKRVLLADDQEGVRQAIKMLLAADDHCVTEASNGKEAFELFSHHNFDLVITDFHMPGMHGGELVLKIKAVSPSLPVIMITGFANDLRGFSTKVDAVLTKPFSFPDLRRVIAQVLVE